MTWQVPHEFAPMGTDTDGVDPDSRLDRPWLVGRDLAVLAGADRRLTQLQVFFECKQASAGDRLAENASTEYIESALSPWGPCVLGFAARGLAVLSFAEGSPWRPVVGSAPEPQTVHPLFRGDLKDLSLHLRGSAFQLAVWRALLCVRRGCATTYGAIAREIGQPRAARAVGAAVGRNPVAWIVPCHRVLPANGSIGGFRWGAALKRRMLQAEGVAVTAS